MVGPVVTIAMHAAHVVRAPKVAARLATVLAATGRQEIARQVTAPEVIARLPTGRPVSAPQVIGHGVSARQGTVRQVIAPHSATARRGVIARRVMRVLRAPTARRVRQVTGHKVTVRHAPTVLPEVMALRVVSVPSARPAARKGASGVTVVDVCKARDPSLVVKVLADPVGTVAAGQAASHVVTGRAIALHRRQ